MQTPLQQQLLVATVGDTPGGDLAAAIALLADQYGDLDAPYAALLLPGQSLERLVIERDLVKIKLAWAEGLVSNRTDQAQSQESDIAKAIRTRAASLDSQLADLAEKLRLSVPPAIGVLTTVSPSSPPLPAPFPNADDVRYQGSPYLRPWKPQTS